jgi:hypothetical protein
VVVAIFSGATIKIEVAAVAVFGVALESLTCIVKIEVAAVVGVPVIAPVDAVRFNPAGSDPDETLQLYGVTPPFAAAAVA